jgi:hypothetical protein
VPLIRTTSFCPISFASEGPEGAEVGAGVGFGVATGLGVPVGTGIAVGAAVTSAVGDGPIVGDADPPTLDGEGASVSPGDSGVASGAPVAGIAEPQARSERSSGSAQTSFLTP